MNKNAYLLSCTSQAAQRQALRHVDEDFQLLRCPILGNEVTAEVNHQVLRERSKTSCLLSLSCLLEESREVSIYDFVRSKFHQASIERNSGKDFLFTLFSLQLLPFLLPLLVISYLG